MIKFLSQQNLGKWKGKVALLRIDLNIEPGEETNAYRIDAVLPTIRLLLKNKIKIVFLSHRGRPKKFERKLSLKVFAPILQKKIGRTITFISYFNFSIFRKQIANPKGGIFLLENLRFLRGEDKNSKNLARDLAALGDFYVNDAFAVSHRVNASVVAITDFLPSFGGLLLEREIKNLKKVMKGCRRPLVVILGGAKVSDKIGVINYFLDKADHFLFGGGPANTFFAASGVDIGDSLFDKASLSFVKKLTDLPKIILPIDVRRDNGKILDIGFVTMRKYEEIIKNARTIIWNGPIGLFEKKGFEDGTRAVWGAIAANKSATSIIGGGETTASMHLLGKKPKLPKKVFISTGGGAMLEYLSGRKLPGIKALEQSHGNKTYKTEASSKL